MKLSLNVEGDPMTELSHLPDRLLRNFVRAFEDGRVQRRPRLRFVDAEGRACIVGAMAGVASSRALARTEVFRTFRSGPLLSLSRRFEAAELTAEDVYDACVLELARRAGGGPDAAAASRRSDEQAAGVSRLCGRASRRTARDAPSPPDPAAHS